MPAQLRVTTPSGPPFVTWIQSEAVRIGSADFDAGEGVDMCIAGIAPHAATVLYRKGRYHVINRSDNDLQLGRRAIPPGEQSLWNEGTPLRLTREIRVDLACLQDASPLRRASWRELPAPDAIEKERERRKRARNTTWCFGITLLSIFLTAVAINLPRRDPLRAACSQAVGMIDSLPRTDRAELIEVRGWLLRGYSLEQRRDQAAAHLLYRLARDQLQSLQPGKADLETRQHLVNYLKSRLTATNS